MKTVNRLFRAAWLLPLAGYGIAVSNAQTRTLTVNSTPNSSVPVTVSPVDNASQGNGSTSFTRTYNNNTSVTLTAPFANFVKWTKDGQWFATSPTATVGMDANHTMTAVYTTTPVVGPFTNGSFESEFTGWTWSGSAETVKVKTGLPTTNGSTIIEFNSNNTPNDGVLTQIFTTTPGKSYTVTFDQGVLSYSTLPQILQLGITGSSPLITQNFSLNGIGGGNVNYVTRAVTFVANSSTTTMTFRDQSAATNAIDLLLDNVTVTEGGSPVVGTNLLFNGSFEQDYNGWNPSGSTRIEAPGPPYTTDGLKMLSFNVGEAPTDGSVSQSFGTTPGSTYAVQFDFGTLGYKNSLQTVRTVITGAGGGDILNRTASVQCREDYVMVFIPVSYTFVANSGVTTLTISDASATGNALDGFVDSVRVVATSSGPNTAPTAVADSYSTSANTALVIPAPGVLGNDTDPQSNPLTAALNVAPTHGTVTLNANGSFTYTPAGGYTGPDSFTYHANDGSLDSGIVTVTLAVNAAGSNVITNGSFESDFAGWTTTGNQVIQASAPYVASNGSKLVGFNGANQTPNAVLTQTFATVAGQSYSLTFDAGVLSYNTNTQTVQVKVDGAANLLTKVVTVTGLGGGAQRWVPQTFGFVADGTSATLKFTDQSTSTNGLDLTLDNVKVIGAGTAVNTAPTAVADSYTTAQNTALVIPAPGVLGNDTDAEGNPLTAVVNVAPGHGSVTLNTDGGFTYTPAGGYSGPDSFTYHANDGALDSNIVTVSLTVTAPGSAVLVNGSFENGFTGWTKSGNLDIQSSSPYVPTDGSKLVGFNGANTTPDAYIYQDFATVPGQTYTLTFDVGVLSFNTSPQSLKVSVTSSISLLNQTITLNGFGGGSQRWQPQTFTFVANTTAASLGFADVSTNTNGLDLTLDNVRLTTPAGGGNTPPVAADDSYSTPQNTALVVNAAAGVLTNDQDAQGDPLTPVLVQNVLNGTLTLNPNGSFTYTPNNGFAGVDSFSYRANDGTANSNLASVNISVSAPTSQLIVNGSFENGFTGWTPTGNQVIESAAPYAATNGTKLVGFNGGDKTPNGVLSQSFPTEVGRNYILSFNVGNLSFVNGQQKMGITVTGSGNLLSRQETLGAAPTGQNVWVTRSYSFVANSTTSTLTFTDQSTMTQYLDLTLDNVSVVADSGVPNSAPTAVADSYTTPQNTALVVAAPGLLSNDSDPEGSPLTAVGVLGAANGALTLNATGGFTYTPNNGFTGSDSFTYRANDGVLDSNIVTVSITVTGTPPPSGGAFANGSFETGSFSPWTTSGGTANSLVIDSSIGGTNGSKIAVFNSAQSPATAVLSQTFNTTPGVLYNLAFDLGVFGYNTSQQSTLVKVTGSGTLLSQATSITGVTGQVKWEARTFSFTANSATTTLSFTDTSPTTNSIDMLLDNVRVTNANSRTLTIDSVVAGGVPLTVSPADNDGASNGNALLTRNYNAGATVNVTAPGTAANGATFVKWVKDGVDHAATPSTSVTVSANTNLVAIYSGGTFPPLGANIIQNGSFETNAGDSIANNWTTVWGRVNGSTRIEQPGAASGYPTDGNNILSFNVGNTPNDGVASQSFATTVGTSYTLQLDIGAYGGPQGAAVNQTLNIGVVGNGTLLSKSVTLLGGNGNAIAWAPRTYTFTANSTTTFLYLSDGSATSNGTDLFVDNVRVRPGTQAPSTIVVNTTPGAGKVVTVNTPDLAGQGTGTASFSRVYSTGTVVQMVAPYQNFVKWLKDGQWYATNPSISLVADGNHTMTAVYTDTPVLGPFQNGSFESEFAGWTWSGSQQSVKVKDGLPSTDGLFVIEFNSNSSGLDGSISQTFTTNPGTQYNVTFDIGTKAFNTFTQTLKCQVTGSSALVNQNFSIAGTGGGNVNYASKSVSFTANSATTTLTFSDQSFSGDGIDLLLDNVKVVAAMPAPALTAAAVVETDSSVSGTVVDGSTGGDTTVGGDSSIINGGGDQSKVPAPVQGVQVIRGKKYLTITITKPVVPDGVKRVVQVSPDLMNWFSGRNHTTVITDDDKVLKVRDNTPIRSGVKRYIRVKPGK